jgi:hypothetical protein
MVRLPHDTSKPSKTAYQQLLCTAIQLKALNQRCNMAKQSLYNTGVAKKLLSRRPPSNLL